MTVLEVFADVRCPFTHVGLRKLVERRSADEIDLVVHVRAWPLELVNESPLDVDLIADEVAQLRSTVAPGLFAHFDPGAFPGSSLPALGLAARAYARDVRMGERVSLLLRDALFEDGRDISRPDELARIADLAGAPHLAGSTDGEQLVMADWEEGRRRGVIGSPHFFVGDTSFFCPSLDIQHVDGQLQMTFDEVAFDRFVRQVRITADRSSVG
jgi:2-hydroxychromene-2-carboxylate isomerase